ncbi:MAG: divalent metal cation transporter [Planctomycetota bacterium]|jgi:Mn2+/Fe2+ NRAMP family transporter
MSEELARVDADREALQEAKNKGPLATVVTYTRLSGPGWLQSALTLGGGSLGSSLYLGVLAGFAFLWLQPLAMILGIVMLSAIGYVAMSIEERPFQAINRHINPVLGWGWALASLLANMVWCLPQYALASGVLQNNLLPGVLGADGVTGDFTGKVIISAAILIITVTITWTYDSGGRGVKVYELMLKLVVAAIVACFIGVVLMVTFRGDLQWSQIFRGFIPNFQALFRPAPGFNWLLDAVPQECREYWSSFIVGEQRDRMISAAATAVGINMTFLLPYSMIRRGWNKDFRGLARFDLATGMFIPFLLATSCVVIASANQFHPVRVTEAERTMIEPANTAVLPELAERQAAKHLDGRLRHQLGAEEYAELSEKQKETRREPLTRAEHVLASRLVNKKALDLAKSLAPLTGEFTANILFGLGVLGMTLSSITLLMLISGFVICEILGLPPKGWPNRLGALAATTGVLGPFLWSHEASFYVVVPTSVFCFTLLPVAYVTFLLMMNSKRLLGDEMPTGARRFTWNTLMGIAVVAVSVGSIYMVYVKAGFWGLAGVAAFVLLAVIVHFAWPRHPRSQPGG